MHIDDMVQHADKFQVSKLHKFPRLFMSIKTYSAWQTWVHVWLSKTVRSLMHMLAPSSACHCCAKHRVCLAWYVCAQRML